MEKLNVLEAQLRQAEEWFAASSAAYFETRSGPDYAEFCADWKGLAKARKAHDDYTDQLQGD
jgi:hypothetical protein